MTEHLVVSTLVLATAMAAACLLPLTARTRYALLFCGLLEFAVPTALFRFLPAEVTPEPLRILGGEAAGMAMQTATRTNWIPMVWAAIALLLFGRWLLIRTRTIAAALHSSAPPSPRELDAVRAAREALRIRLTIDTVRSPLFAAPAMMRIFRPVIVLPAQGCDALTEDELRSLVLHECAHVARQDNLAALLQALATSLLWFHPLVWIASHTLTIAREEACDEAVADAMPSNEPYLSALTKICRSIVVQNTAGVSCMANGQIRERMEHLMSYEAIRRNSWSHRTMLGIAIVLLAFSTVAAQNPGAANADQYDVKFTVDPATGTSSTFEFTVTEIATGKIISRPRLTTSPGILARIQSGTQGLPGRERAFEMSALPNADGSGTITFDAFENSELIQHQVIEYAAGNAPRKYTGEPVTMQLKNADLRDVLTTLGELTGRTIDAPADLTGSVTIDIADVPWDKLLDIVLRQNGLVAEVDAKTIRVSKQKE